MPSSPPTSESAGDPSSLNETVNRDKLFVVVSVLKAALEQAFRAMAQTI